MTDDAPILPSAAPPVPPAPEPVPVVPVAEVGTPLPPAANPATVPVPPPDAPAGATGPTGATGDVPVQAPAENTPAPVETTAGPQVVVVPSPSQVPPLPAVSTTANAPSTTAVGQVVVMRPRDDDDVLTGSFADVVDGEHKGRYGVYTQTASTGEDGYPVTVVFRTRDDQDEVLIVRYEHLRPSQAGRR